MATPLDGSHVGRRTSRCLTTGMSGGLPVLVTDSQRISQGDLGRRFRWLAPILAATILAVALVIGGILAALLVMSSGVLGAMLLVQLRGHAGQDRRVSGHDWHRHSQGGGWPRQGTRGVGPRRCRRRWSRRLTNT